MPHKMLHIRLELDNNRVKRSIKPFFMERKSRLFCNTPRGAIASAIIYSIVETAKEDGLNLYDYLTLLFRSLPDMDVKNPDAVRQLPPWSVDLLKINKVVIEFCAPCYLTDLLHDLPELALREPDHRIDPAFFCSYITGVSA